MTRSVFRPPRSVGCAVSVCAAQGLVPAGAVTQVTAVSRSRRSLRRIAQLGQRKLGDLREHASWRRGLRGMFRNCCASPPGRRCTFPRPGRLARRGGWGQGWRLRHRVATPQAPLRPSPRRGRLPAEGTTSVPVDDVAELATACSESHTMPRTVVETETMGATSEPADDAMASLPRANGLYARWAATNVLPHLPGPSHPADAFIRLLYVGLATNLRTRITRNHLRRSGSSTLRRTFRPAAGLNWATYSMD